MIERLVDDEMAETARADDGNARIARPACDGAADRAAEVEAARGEGWFGG